MKAKKKKRFSLDLFGGFQDIKQLLKYYGNIPVVVKEIVVRGKSGEKEETSES